MRESDVRRTLGSPHKELSDDLFRYDVRGQLVDSEFLRVCRDEDEIDALRVLWVALVSADRRLAKLIELLTGDDGRVIPKRFSTSFIESQLSKAGITPQRKAASNIAHYFEQAHVIVPRRHGPEIVGLGSTVNTARSVPLCVAMLADRFRFKGDPVRAAIDRSANRWLNLTPDQFVDSAV